MQMIIAKQNYLKKMGEELKYIDGFDVSPILFRNYLIKFARPPISAPIVLHATKRPPSSSPKRRTDNLYIPSYSHSPISVTHPKTRPQNS
jgi:hypothetical protein